MTAIALSLMGAGRVKGASLLLRVLLLFGSLGAPDQTVVNLERPQAAAPRTNEVDNGRVGASVVVEEPRTQRTELISQTLIRARRRVGIRIVESGRRESNSRSQLGKADQVDVVTGV